MCPSEVIVQAVEIAFARSALVVVLDDGLLGVVPVVGQDAPVRVLGILLAGRYELVVEVKVYAVSSREVAAKQ